MWSTPHSEVGSGLLKNIFSLSSGFFFIFFSLRIIVSFPSARSFLYLSHFHKLFCLLAGVELLWDKATCSLNCSVISCKSGFHWLIIFMQIVYLKPLFWGLLRSCCFFWIWLQLQHDQAKNSQMYANVIKFSCVLKTLDNYYLPAFKLWQGVTTHKCIWPNESVSTWFILWLIVVSSGLAWIPLLLFRYSFRFDLSEQQFKR